MLATTMRQQASKEKSHRKETVLALLKMVKALRFSTKLPKRPPVTIMEEPEVTDRKCKTLPDDSVHLIEQISKEPPSINQMATNVRQSGSVRDRLTPEQVMEAWTRRIIYDSDELLMEWDEFEHEISSGSEFIWIRATFTPSQQMAEQAANAKRGALDEPTIPPEYEGHCFVFDKHALERLPELGARGPWDHAIELKEGAQPKNCKVYPLSPEEQRALDVFLKEQLDKGYIRPSKSPMAAPFFFVKKKDGALRPVQDYRYLNSQTIKNAYPLPLIPELIDKLKGAQLFSKMDVRWGYNNIRIREGDEWKAAFKTNRGLYEPTVMFFGLTNSLATFQSYMNHVFADLIDEGHVIVYMDDILVFTGDDECEHDALVRRVLQRLKDTDLFLKPEKCSFKQRSIEYLGMIISHDHVGMDPVKMQGLADWPVPTTVKQVQSFLGFGNFYRRFIKDFSTIARPLYDLTKKGQGWDWTAACDEVFERLKHAFTSTPVLIMPDVTKPFHIEADSSNFATGAVLTQIGSDGHRHPCAFLSQSFMEAERNYEIYDKELLAIIRALEEWRHYLEGAPHVLEIWTDHKNLSYFREAHKLNRRQARWALYLTRFHFQLVHKPSTTMVVPDTLSRKPDHDLGGG